MKNLPTLCCLLLSVNLLAQNQKGFSVSPVSQNSSSGKTYALIVGISKYQNANIPQLQFADRDAMAFRDYLMASGVDSNNIVMLLNEHAKSGDIWINIDHLTDLANKGDHVYFYFSCHGDVEGKTITHDAFLLPYDAPQIIYSGGGTISIYYLKGYLATLSAKGVQVIFIADACHSGNLSGGREGMAITGDVLKETWKDEVKILSCQPGQISLEGKEWGNGRGLFSYELINGLAGLADKNENGKVNLRELNLYLMDKVPDEASPSPQDPIVSGNMDELLSNANKNYLSRITETNYNHAFASVDMRGNEEGLLKGLPDTVRLIYQKFSDSLLIEETRGVFGDFSKLYKQLETIPETDSTRLLLGIMKRNLAAAIINMLNQIIDFSVRNKSYVGNRYAMYSFEDFHAELKELIGEQRIRSIGLKPILDFNAVMKNGGMNMEEAPDSIIDRLKKIVEDNPSASYASEMLSVKYYVRNEFTMSKDYALQAIQYSPNFAYPIRRVATCYLILKEPDSTIFYSHKLMMLDPHAPLLRSKWSPSLKRYTADTARLDTNIFIRDASERLALAYFLLGNKDSSDYYFHKATERDSHSETFSFQNYVSYQEMNLLYDQHEYNRVIPFYMERVQKLLTGKLEPDSIIKGRYYCQRTMGSLSYYYNRLAICYSTSSNKDSALYFLSKKLEMDYRNYKGIIKEPYFHYDRNSIDDTFEKMFDVPSEKEFDLLRSTPEFQALMKKYFPDQYKE